MINISAAEKVDLNIVYPSFQIKSEGFESLHNDELKPKIFRANAQQIQNVQTLLQESRFYKGNITGKLSRDTRNSLKKFQKTANLKVTGTINQETFNRINSFAVSEIQPNLFDNIEIVEIEAPNEHLPNKEIFASYNLTAPSYRFTTAKPNPTAFFFDGKSDYLIIAAIFLLFSFVLIAAFIF